MICNEHFNSKRASVNSQSDILYLRLDIVDILPQTLSYNYIAIF